MPERSAPGADAHLPAWQDRAAARSAAGVKVSSVVAARRERAMRRGGGSGSPRESGVDKREIAISTFGLLWIVLALAVVVVSLAFLVGSFMMHGILKDISTARNFDDATARFNQYDTFFDEVERAKFKVGEEDPSILSGVKTYLWTVSPPGIDAPWTFSWQHDLENNEVRPTTNAALLLDLEMDLVKPEEIEKLAKHYSYNPDDEGAKAIIARDAAYFAPSNSDNWGATGNGEALPPLPPLIDPKAKNRKNNSAASADEETEAEANEGEEAEPAAVAGPPSPDELLERPDEHQPARPIEVHDTPPPAPEPPAEPEPEPAPAPEDGGGEDDEDEGDATPVG